MTTPTPASLPADGNLRVTWVPAIADPAAPSAAVLNGTSAVDLTCYLTPDGYAPATDQAVINDDRLCSTDTFEQPGRKTNTLDITYVFRGQDASAADNKAYTTMKENTGGFIVERWGKAYDAAYTNGTAATTTAPAVPADVVSVTPVKAGVQMELPPEANSILKVSQKMFVTGRKRRQVTVVA